MATKTRSKALGGLAPCTPSEAGRVSGAPTLALERPQNLKKWATDLTRIIKGQESTLFEGWDFGPCSLTRADFTRILKKMTGCGSVVELRAALDRNTGEMGDPVVHAANYCGQHTICPYCAGRVQDRRGARFREPILAMARAYPFAYLLTATIPPRPTWREDLCRLIEGWQAFRRMGQARRGRKRGRSGGEWGKVRAALAKVEIKRGERSGLPHCHYHAIVFTSEMLDYRLTTRLPRPVGAAVKLQPVANGWGLRNPERAIVPWVRASKITAEWYKATEGAAINFRVDPIRYRKDHKRKGLSYEESVVEQSREVLKYATKFDSHPETGAEALFARDFVGIRDATYNRRLFASYGDFRQVGGNDFEGGGPHLSEGPQIYESRWRGVRYSPLIERSRPVFLNTDATPAVSARLTVLNRAQGQVRRMRSAVLGAKRHYRETGGLRPAWYMRREYLEDGGFTDSPAALEVPAYVVSNPADSSAWEKWVDEVSEAGRDYYSAVKENLAILSHENLDGTMEDARAMHAVCHRAWLRSDAHQRIVDRLFIRTIVRSQDRLSDLAASPPPS
jgi:hypothetical protein